MYIYKVFFFFLRCVSAMSKLRHSGKMRVGGPHNFVMVDESKFTHKRKYNRGRASNRASWGFGMLAIKNNRKKPILKIVRHRSANHLMPHIKRYVRCGSTIVSDGWRSYHHLRDEGYNHLTVNHKECFVDPVTGAHTQNVERLWVCKSTIWRLRGNRTENLLRDHLNVIEWTYWRGNHHRSGPLAMLLHDIRKQYPV
ncbi:hypothetical protein ACEWY4_007786 [Coilia grayii]|uniref:ISXO2-like transposase domain-containing protein n=1 Tax=Coilia grayii TaxID=363190 RepID=A0ABD1K924_9TELE